MFNFLKSFFDYNSREINRLSKIVSSINALEKKARSLKERDFKTETNKLKSEIQEKKKDPREFLPWAFALVREASRRTIGERHYDVQLMAGIALFEGKIAEQKTGEGKTLSATTALYLRALAGKGSHLVTVNDYLARRDVGWMGPIYNFLGLSCAAIISDKSFLYDVEYVDKNASDWRLINLRPTTRGEAYKADITYGINSEFGFDYLRDNMAMSSEEIVQRGYYYAIVDEVDSVLIDEARTPHIISAPYDEDVSKYYEYARLVNRLSSDTDYVIDEKMRTAHLTEKGIEKLEKMLNIENIYEKDFNIVFHVEAALKARTLFIKDRDYIVKDNEVIIVDEFTGRLLFGRRFSEGIHQAIEAKEGVPIKKESKTLATVSLQNYFRMYEHLAGMTGTAATEAEEFHKIYKLDVVVIPTNVPMIRKDYPDYIYKTERGKFSAVADEVEKNYKKGRPVLVGTTSIEKNELLSALLKKRGIPHEVLNAKNHEREAIIITNAGKKGAVTVATNMAGRGVDIKLGGVAPSFFEISKDRSKREAENEFNKKMLKWEKENKEVIALGGLLVIGTERHESRRIDNQLRGRAGRQGDPGETRFFVSLEDDLMRIFGGEQVSRLMTMFNIPENQPLENVIVSKAIEQAQIKVEAFNFDIRKSTLEYDDVLDKQRSVIYSLRRKIVLSDKSSNDLRSAVIETCTRHIHELAKTYLYENQNNDEAFVKEIVLTYGISKDKIDEIIKKANFSEIEKYFGKLIEKILFEKESLFGKGIFDNVVRFIFLVTIDKYWTEHLTAMNDLREGIGLRGYAQVDPLNEYKNEAFKMFEKLLSDIDFEVVRRIFSLDEKEMIDTSKVLYDESQFQYQSPTIDSAYSIAEKGVSNRSYSSDNSNNNQFNEQKIITKPTEIAPGITFIPTGTNVKKPKRNEPCWCGSGKKYKKCHYPN